MIFYGEVNIDFNFFMLINLPKHVADKFRWIPTKVRKVSASNIARS
jgi:hypothetical protein